MWRSLVRMIVLIKNVNAIPARGMHIVTRKQRLKDMLLTEAAKVVRKLNINEKKTHVQDIQLVSAAVKSEHRFVIQAVFRNLIPAKTVILVPIIMTAAERGNIAQEQLAMPMKAVAVFLAKAIIFLTNVITRAVVKVFTEMGTARKNAVPTNAV